MPARSVPLFIAFLCLMTAIPGVNSRLIDNGDGTVTELGSGTTWVADGAYAVIQGGLPDVVMDFPSAMQFITAMNSGRVENFGHKDWRIPTIPELRRWNQQLADSYVPIPGKETLQAFLDRPRRISSSTLGAWNATRRRPDPPDKVYIWPVRGAIGAPPGFEKVAVFATNSIWLRQNSDILSGDVVANDDSSGPYLADGRELVVGISATTAPGFQIKGDRVKVKTNGLVGGDAHYNDLVNNGTIQGNQFTPLDLPVFSVLPPFTQEPPRAGAQDVTVALGGSATLVPGDYGILKIKKNGVVTLTGGIYNFAEIDAGVSTELLFQAPSEVRVQGRFMLDKNSYFGSEATFLTGGPPYTQSAGETPVASEIIVFVAGINGNTGNLGATPKAAKIGISCDVFANFYVPNGTLLIKQNSAVTGAFLGRDVQVGLGVQVSLDSFYENAPPTADPQDVVTAGDVNLMIPLSGTDPEGDLLTFSVESLPSQGALLDGATPITSVPFTLSSAGVIYDPATGGDLEDSFSFGVSDPAGGKGTAQVRINPPADSPPPPDPPGNSTVVADDVSTETIVDVPVTVTLIGEAPCDQFDLEGLCTEGVALSFAVEGGCDTTACSGPSNGALSSLTQGTAAVPRTATVLYTPGAGFSGTDSFEFEACGTVGTQLVCDRATATVAVFAAGPPPPITAESQELATPLDTSVAITLAIASVEEGSGTAGLQEFQLSRRQPPRKVFPKATLALGASVAGNVADCEPLDNFEACLGDGLGDNKNSLPGPVPVLVAASPDQTGGPGSNGVVRIHMEWDISDLAGETVQDATVTLTTEKGSRDILDTLFFAGDQTGNGSLDLSDFESPATQISGVVMPVTAGVGTFTFDVSSPLQSAIDGQFTHLIIQGRSDEGATVVQGDRTLQVRSSANGNLTIPCTGLTFGPCDPLLDVTTGPSLTFAIVALPAHGTLLDSNQQAVTCALINDPRSPNTCQTPVVLPSASLTYTPAAGFVGTDGFGFQVADGLTVAVGGIVIGIGSSCADDESACDDGRGS